MVVSIHLGVDLAVVLRILACSKARYMSALEWPVRSNRATMAGTAERVRRRGDGSDPGLLEFMDEECGLVYVSGDGGGGGDLGDDAAARDLEGSYSAYNLSSSSLASGTIAPWSMRVSRYCEALYAVSNKVINLW
jgi:hypothetical protein